MLFKAARVLLYVLLRERPHATLRNTSAIHFFDDQNNKYVFKQLISRSTARAERLAFLGEIKHTSAREDRETHFHTNKKRKLFVLVWSPTNGLDCWQCMKSQFSRSRVCTNRPMTHTQRAHVCWDRSWLSEDNVITEIGELPQKVYPCGFFLPHLKAQLGCLETKLVWVCE